MAYIDELYKPDTRLPNDVINLVNDAIRAVKGAMYKDKASRRFQGYLSHYSEDYGDSYPIIHPTENRTLCSQQLEQYGWGNIKALIEKRLREEVGLRNFEVRFIPYTYEVKEEVGRNLFGRPKYETKTKSAHKLWINASW